MEKKLDALASHSKAFILALILAAVIVIGTSPISDHQAYSRMSFSGMSNGNNGGMSGGGHHCFRVHGVLHCTTSGGMHGGMSKGMSNGMSSNNTGGK
jgi:hypothetical protein